MNAVIYHLVLAVSTAVAATAAGAAELRVETTHGLKATPYDVQVQTAEDGTTISGQLRKSAANPGRRLLGQVQIEVLDDTGRVIATHAAEAQRAGTAKHTQQGQFAVTIDALPADAAALRIGYR